MRIRVLGSAAGGGFPQWNCGCPNCRGIRSGTLNARPRTQACVAVSGDDEHWFLLGASPEIRAQIESYPPLHPRERRHSPIVSVFLCNGDLDHTLGLLSLREWSRLTVHATPAVRDAFCDNNVLNRALQRYEGHSRWVPLEAGAAQSLAGGLSVEAVAAPGKPPLYATDPAGAAAAGVWNVGFRFTQAGRVFGYFPGAAHVTSALRAAIDDLDLLLFDGTLWSDTELGDLKLVNVRGKDMAHLPVGGPDGSLQALADLRVPQRGYIHINNTNPMLREDSAEAASVRNAGWFVTEDAQEFVL